LKFNFQPFGIVAINADSPAAAGDKLLDLRIEERERASEGMELIAADISVA